MLAWFKAGVNSEVESLRIFVELQPKQGLSASENGSLLENMSSRDKTPGRLAFINGRKKPNADVEGRPHRPKGAWKWPGIRSALARTSPGGGPDQTRRRPGSSPAADLIDEKESPQSEVHVDVVDRLAVRSNQR